MAVNIHPLCSIYGCCPCSSHVHHYIVTGDATNLDFCARTPQLIDGLQWVLLTLPTHNANKAAALLLQDIGNKGKVAATIKYGDEAELLSEIGVDSSFNIFAEAGSGFANDLKSRLNRSS